MRYRRQDCGRRRSFPWRCVRIRFRAPSQPQVSFVRISVCNQVMRNSYKRGQGRSCSHCNLQDFGFPSKENQVSLLKIFCLTEVQKEISGLVLGAEEWFKKSATRHWEHNGHLTRLHSSPHWRCTQEGGHRGADACSNDCLRVSSKRILQLRGGMRSTLLILI